jgi:hypothetical protein
MPSEFRDADPRELRVPSSRRSGAQDRRLFAMISKTQSEALTLLAELCELSPDVRLGQLFAHLGFLGEDQTERTLWDINDEQLLSVLHHHRAELLARQSGSEAERVGHPLPRAV